MIADASASASLDDASVARKLVLTSKAQAKVERAVTNHEYVRHALTLFRQGRDFCVYDLETTGKNAEKGAKTLQIAARRYHYDHATRTVRLISEMNVFMADPTITEIDPYLTENVHRIAMVHIRDSAAAAARGARLVTPVDGWWMFAKMTRGAILMGQNIIGFDNPFGNFDAARWHINLKLDSARSIDTLLLARQLWDLDNKGQNKTGYKLRSLASMLNVRTDPALDHNALGDINTTWLVFLAELPHLRGYEAKFLRGAPDQYKRTLGGLRTSIPKPYSAPSLAARLARAARIAEGLPVKPVTNQNSGQAGRRAS
jgi:DNA polymerase III alpha subunit (gram-positive type)